MMFLISKTELCQTTKLFWSTENCYKTGNTFSTKKKNDESQKKIDLSKYLRISWRTTEERRQRVYRDNRTNERNVENHSEPEKDRENKTQFASGFMIAACSFKVIRFAAKISYTWLSMQNLKKSVLKVEEV